MNLGSRNIPALALVAILVLAALAAGVLGTDRLSPLDPRDEVTAAATRLSPARSWAAPVLSTAHAGGWQPRVALPRAVLAIGGPAALDGFAGALAAAFALVLFLAARRLGSRLLPALAASLAPVAAGALHNPRAFACGFTLQALLAASVLLVAARPGPRWRLAPLVLALAVDGEPSWFVLAFPVLMSLFAGPVDRQTLPSTERRTGVRSWRRLAVTASVLFIAVASLQAVVATWATFASMPVGPGESRSAAGLGEIIAVTYLGLHVGQLGLGAQLIAGARFLVASWMAVWGLLGTVLAVAGTAVMMKNGQHRPAAVLVLGWLFGGCMLAASRAPADAAPAMILVLIAGAALVARGGTWLLDQASDVAALSRGDSRWVRLALGFGAGVLVVLPLVLHLAPGRAPSRPFEGAAGTAYAEAIGRVVAGPHVFVSNNPAIDRLALDLGPRPRLAGPSQPTRIPRDPAVIARFLRAGYAVYALNGSIDELAAMGVWFTERPLEYTNLGRYFDTMPRGTIAGIASSGGPGPGVRHSPLLFADRVGGQRQPRASALLPLCLLGTVGAADGALQSSAMDAADVREAAGHEVGRTGSLLPATVVLHANAAEAAVNVVQRGVVRAESGTAIAVVDGIGDLVGRAVVDASTGFQLRVPRDVVRFAQVDTVAPCVNLDAGQATDVTPLSRGGAIGWSRSDPLNAIGGSASALLLSDAAGEQRVPMAPNTAWRKVAVRPADGRRLTATNVSAGRVRVCAAQKLERLLFEAPGQRVAFLELGNVDDPAFGPGWYLPENEGGQPFRWAAGTADFFIRLESPIAARVEVTGWPAVDLPPSSIELVVNGQPLETLWMAAGLRPYAWTIPVSRLRAGLNELRLRVSRTAQGATDERVLGINVRRVRFERLE